MRNRLGLIALAMAASLHMIFLNSCRHSNDGEIEIYSMDFETVHTNEILSIILDVIVKGDTVMVNQYSGDHFVNWFSLTSGELLKSAIAKGNGPGEMIAPIVNAVNDSLLIFDRQKFRLFKADFMCDSITPFAEGTPFWSSQSFPLKNGLTVISKIPFGVTDEEVANTRFALADADSVLSHFGSYPMFSQSDKKSDVEQRAHFHQVLGFCELPGNRFAVSSSHVLSIYALNGDNYELVKEIEVAPYEYTSTSATNHISATTKILDGYNIRCSVGLVFHAGKIYIPLKKGHDKDISIHCYDTDLNLVGEIIPSQPIQLPFTIDEQGRVIAFVEEEKSNNICISKTSVDEYFK